MSKINDNDPIAGAQIIGHVFDVKGVRIAGAKVTCNGRTSLTLFDGTFKFNALETGTYVVTVTQKGFERQSLKAEVEKDKIISLNFTLTQKKGVGKIYGYVFDLESKMHIPSEGFIIMIMPVENNYVEINSKNGYYEFSDLPSGEYAIRTSIYGYEDKLMEIALANNEKKRFDFYCRKTNSIEPPWG